MLKKFGMIKSNYHWLLLLSTMSYSHDSGVLQQFTFPPPPEASALFKSTEILVSNTTGVPAINIPIYEIRLAEMSNPIELRYNSSGIKVDEIASNVGLGWALEAGGMISTMVVGNPDFERSDE